MRARPSRQNSAGVGFQSKDSDIRQKIELEPSCQAPKSDVSETPSGRGSLVPDLASRPSTSCRSAREEEAHKKRRRCAKDWSRIEKARSNPLEKAPSLSPARPSSRHHLPVHPTSSFFFHPLLHPLPLSLSHSPSHPTLMSSAISALSLGSLASTSSAVAVSTVFKSRSRAAISFSSEAIVAWVLQKVGGKSGKGRCVAGTWS